MINSIEKIKSGYSLYNSSFEYLGKSGEFYIAKTDGEIKWVQLLDNPEYSWIYGTLTKSYNRGFVLKDYKLSKNKFKKPY
tara:strand:- start:1564 stop:1803 length:240 start_codon:yes stop_codon:yes gene_type:complete